MRHANARAYISPISRLDLAYISHISPLHEVRHANARAAARGLSARVRFEEGRLGDMGEI